MNANLKNETKIGDDDFSYEEENLEEDETNVDVYTKKFKNPVLYKGEEIGEITFDWTKLTGADSMKIESEARAKKQPVGMKEFSDFYLVRMAVRAGNVKVGADFFEKLPLKTYNDITSAARDFLLKSES